MGRLRGVLIAAVAVSGFGAAAVLAGTMVEDEPEPKSDVVKPKVERDPAPFVFVD